MLFNRVASYTFSRWHRPWEEGEEPDFGVRQVHVPMWLLELLAFRLAEPQLQAGTPTAVRKEKGKGEGSQLWFTQAQAQRKGL